MLKPLNSAPKLAGRSRQIAIALGIVFAFLLVRPLLLRPSAIKKSGGPPVVEVARAVQKPMPVTLQSIGHVQAIASVAVRARIDGQIVKVPVREGQDVRVGDILFLLDDREAQAALAAAKAALARDEAQAAFARREADRAKKLSARGNLSVSAREQANATAAALAATVEADRAAVADKETTLSYTVITAPISGRLGAISAKEGNTVESGGSTPLVTINQIAPIDVTFTAPQKSLGALQVALSRGAVKVSAAIPGTNGPAQMGTLSFLDNAIDPKTGTLAAKATFANDKGALWPGQFVNVDVTLKTEPHALVVPAQAVQMSQDGPYVFVVGDDNTAEMRPVVIDRSQGNETVLAQGVKAGETVITTGQLRVRPGGKVMLPQDTEAPKKKDRRKETPS